jgi:pilus assembly protein CpaD
MNKSKNSISPRIGTAIMIGLATILVTGCTTYYPSHGPTNLRNKITVAETVERLELFTQPTGLNLSARDEDAVSDFIYEYGQSGQGPLYINVPGNTGNRVGIEQAKTSIVSRMRDMGIDGSVLQVGQYASKEGQPAPVVVSYRRLTTAPINCHQGSALTLTSRNQPYENFGCAQTANLAAMIDDPRQLLAPYDLDAPLAVRRTSVFQKYIEGQSTQTPRPGGQEVAAGG